jgi:hypothetical protein
VTVRFVRFLLIALVVLVPAALTSIQPSQAASPASGTVSAASPQVTWSGGPLIFTTVGTGCDPALPVMPPTCDAFGLTIGTLNATANDVVISVAAGAPTDVLVLYVYGPDGTLVADDDTFTANPQVILRDVAPGAYSVRVEAILGAGATVSYNALAAATNAGAAPDPEVPCNGDDEGLGPPPPEILDAVLNDDNRNVRLDVLVLLDGVSQGFAENFFKTVAKPYGEIHITVNPVFQTLAPGTITSDVTTDILNQAKNTLPGRRVPNEFDVVEILTHRDIQALGLNAVAGQAECIGGSAFKQHSFEVSEAQETVDQSGVAFGPIVLVPNVAAKITAHEMGHLFGGQHHYANCIETIHPDEFIGTDSSPCDIMFNDVDFISLHFGTLNGRIIRGYALTYAAANDNLPPPTATNVSRGGASPNRPAPSTTKVLAVTGGPNFGGLAAIVLALAATLRRVARRNAS